MRSQTLTNTLLGIVAIGLVAIVSQCSFRPLKVHAATQARLPFVRWNYKHVRSRFKWEQGKVTGEQFVMDDGQQILDPQIARLYVKQLGREGWELVSVEPLSLFASQGSTTDLLYVFKRPCQACSGSQDECC
jgi:hypothetical protein